MNFSDVTLSWDMYRNNNCSFTECLENLDSSDKYFGSGYEGLDAYQRQLKRFDIKVRGEASGIVADFFKTDETKILFPEYIERCVNNGMYKTDKEERINELISLKVPLKTSTEVIDEIKILNYNQKNPYRNFQDSYLPLSEFRRENFFSVENHSHEIQWRYSEIANQNLAVFSSYLEHIGRQFSYVKKLNAIHNLESKKICFYKDIYKAVSDFSWHCNKILVPYHKLKGLNYFPSEINSLVQPISKKDSSNLILMDTNCALIQYGGEKIKIKSPEVLINAIEDKNTYEKNSSCKMSTKLILSYVFVKQIEDAAISCQIEDLSFKGEEDEEL